MEDKASKSAQLRASAERIERLSPGFAKTMRRTADQYEALEGDATPASKARHGSDGLWGYVSMRCDVGIDGCDDRACVCKCHSGEVAQ